MSFPFSREPSRLRCWRCWPMRVWVSWSAGPSVVNMTSRMPKPTATLALILLCSSCAPRSSIVVASKNFTEQVLLGEIAAQQIERRLSVRVDRKLNLGGTLLAHQALLSGQIDLYPEYTGTALTAVLKQPPTSDAKAAF